MEIVVNFAASLGLRLNEMHEGPGQPLLLLGAISHKPTILGMMSEMGRIQIPHELETSLLRCLKILSST
jgi:hypothetical protein